MYEPFFGLTEPAFSLSPDPRFLWLSDTHEEAMAALTYGITRGKGFIVLTGEIGSGKTTLLRAVLARVRADLLDDPRVAVITSTTDLSALDLLKLVCSEFGIQGRRTRADLLGGTNADYLIALKEFVVDQKRGGMTTFLVIDEAQDLWTETLEQVRLLSNLETDSEKLLPIILAGQPELGDRLAQPSLRQLRQRIAVEYWIEPLRRDEVLPYLQHRIGVAGGRYDRTFTAGTDSIFFEYSKGCPRLVNLLADASLLAAYARGLRPVPPALIEAKAKEMSVTRGPSPGSALGREG